MRKKTTIIKLFLVSCLFAFSFGHAQTPVPVTKIFTDYGGGATVWESGTSGSPNPIRPDNSHNLLGFVWNGVTYSTGVDDARLATHASINTSLSFTALPVSIAPTSGLSGTFIGVGKMYGGSGNVSPVPVSHPLVQYLTDGEHGLDLGTAIFNFPKSGKIEFDVSSISASSIGDGIPDIVLTQLGDISNVYDEFYFEKANGTQVGITYTVNFSSVPDIGWADWKFYYTSTNPPTYNSGPSGNGLRRIRLLALDWSELGLTSTNITEISKFVQKFSGQSDLAFIAYNRGSISLKQPISGFVFNDNNAGVPDGNPLEGVVVKLETPSGTVIATTTTDSNGYYLFNNIGGGTYLVVVEPSGVYADYHVVGNSDGNNSDTLTVVIDNAAAVGNNFGINLPPVAVDDHRSVDDNIPAIVNLAVNDYDFNGGVVVPSTISLILPPGAINPVYDAEGDLVSFEVSGEGTWLVNQLGVLTFTPAPGYHGPITNVQYTIKDNAGLISNPATIYLVMDGFCYKPEVTSGVSLDTKVGITSLKRAGAAGDNWPMVRKGGWLALESHTKGFVLNRIPTTAALNAIPSPVEGMIVYDEEAKCIKIYTTVDSGTTYGWHCYNIQSCPD